MPDPRRPPIDPRHHERRAPICVACGVTALPDETPGPDGGFRCENPDCERFGDEV